MKELEEYRSGNKLAESVQKRLAFLGERLEEISGQDAKLADALETAHQDLKKYEKFTEALAEILPKSSYNVAEISPTSTQEGLEAVVVTESLPEIRHRVERPIVQTSESNLEGRLITLALHGFFEGKKRSSAIAAEITRIYAVQVNPRDLNRALGEVTQKKILQREEASNGSWEYWLYPGAKDRIKEVETK